MTSSDSFKNALFSFSPTLQRNQLIKHACKLRKSYFLDKSFPIRWSRNDRLYNHGFVAPTLHSTDDVPCAITEISAVTEGLNKVGCVTLEHGFRMLHSRLHAGEGLAFRFVSKYSVQALPRWPTWNYRKCILAACTDAQKSPRTMATTRISVANGALPVPPAFGKKRSITSVLSLKLLENEMRHATSKFMLSRHVYWRLY